MRADDRGPRAAADRTGRPYDAAVQTTPAPAASWAVEHHRGTADELHHLEVPERRVLLVMEVTRPALVLGSTQDEATVDRAALDRAGVDLARRRSGGGAVLLVPGEHVWVDVVLPAADALWIDDVGSSSWWLGEAWAAAIAAAGRRAARSRAPAAGGAPWGSERAGARPAGLLRRHGPR